MLVLKENQCVTSWDWFVPSDWGTVVVQNFPSLAPLLQALPPKGWSQLAQLHCLFWMCWYSSRGWKQWETRESAMSDRIMPEWSKESSNSDSSHVEAGSPEKNLLCIPVFLLFSSRLELNIILIRKIFQGTGLLLIICYDIRNKPINRTLKILQPPSSSFYSISQEVW